VLNTWLIRPSTSHLEMCMFFFSISGSGADCTAPIISEPKFRGRSVSSLQPARASPQRRRQGRGYGERRQQRTRTATSEPPPLAHLNLREHFSSRHASPANRSIHARSRNPAGPPGKRLQSLWSSVERGEGLARDADADPVLNPLKRPQSPVTGLCAVRAGRVSNSKPDECFARPWGVPFDGPFGAQQHEWPTCWPKRQHRLSTQTEGHRQRDTGTPHHGGALWSTSGMAEEISQAWRPLSAPPEITTDRVRLTESPGAKTLLDLLFKAQDPPHLDSSQSQCTRALGRAVCILCGSSTFAARPAARCLALWHVLAPACARTL